MSTDLKLERDTFVARTEAVLRDMILEGQIRPGERINEVTLASTLGISRGPLREAVQRLGGQGLLVSLPHRGAFVRTFTRREIVELYEMRAAIELQAVRILTRAEDTAAVERLVTATRTAREVLAQDPTAPFPADLDFHHQLVTSTANTMLMTTAAGIQMQISLARSVSARQPARARAASSEHEEVVDAIVARDTAGACDLMERHIMHSMHNALAALGVEEETHHDV